MSATKTIYDGHIVKLELEDGKWEIVRHADAVAILLLSEGGEMKLVRQRRRAVDADTLEAPAGLIDEGETPEAAARREWYEETGLWADVARCAVVERFFHWEGHDYHEFGFFFRVALTGELPPTVLDNPHVAFRWLPLAELDQHTIYPRCLPQLLQVSAGEIGHFVTDER